MNQTNISNIPSQDCADLLTIKWRLIVEQYSILIALGIDCSFQVKCIDLEFNIKIHLSTLCLIVDCVKTQSVKVKHHKVAQWNGSVGMTSRAKQPFTIWLNQSVSHHYFTLLYCRLAQRLSGLTHLTENDRWTYVGCVSEKLYLINNGKAWFTALDQWRSNRSSPWLCN